MWVAGIISPTPGSPEFSGHGSQLHGTLICRSLDLPTYTAYYLTSWWHSRCYINSIEPIWSTITVRSKETESKRCATYTTVVIGMMTPTWTCPKKLCSEIIS